MAELEVFSIPVLHQFRGLTIRQGMIIQGEAGIAEWSPFPQYDVPEASSWLRAAREVATQGYPPPQRTSVMVNSTIPSVDPATAYHLTREAGCRTAKVKVAEPTQSLYDDIARVEAVRDALGPTGLLRIDANGGWTLDEATLALRSLRPYDLEYVEQPCTSLEDLAALRKLVDVRVAADESIRRSSDPWAVRQAEAADLIVLKVQPLGGIEPCLRLAEQWDMNVVVSSALETSVGLRAGLALAGALPELRYACGLNTIGLLGGDVTTDSLRAYGGEIVIAEVSLDPCRLEQVRADTSTVQLWTRRLSQCQDYCARERSHHG